MSRKRISNDNKKSQKGKLSTKAYLIIVEGETESNYFKAIFNDRQNVKVSVEKDTCAPKNISDIKTVINRNKNSYTKNEIFFVYDTEYDKQLTDIFHNLKQSKFSDNLVLSHSCFELYLLTHFIKIEVNTYLPAKKCLSELQSIVTDYEKPFTIEKFVNSFKSYINNPEIKMFNQLNFSKEFKSFTEVYSLLIKIGIN